jgi:hypothetical protein
MGVAIAGDNLSPEQLAAIECLPKSRGVFQRIRIAPARDVRIDVRNAFKLMAIPAKAPIESTSNARAFPIPCETSPILLEPGSSIQSLASFAG